MRLLPALAALSLTSAALAPTLHAQHAHVQTSVFGHLEQTTRRSNDNTDAYFTLGEHSFFAVGSNGDRLSFLGEFSVRSGAGSSSGFVASIERALARYAYADRHAVIVGKVHSPVNYWNDTYHHGRIFFPTVDRPLAFTHLVPLHTLGVQLQGQNLGKARLGYDFMIGNGIASTDAGEQGDTPAMLAAVHVKPVDGMRLGVSYYTDYMETNAYGAHSGHTVTSSERPATLYNGALDFRLASASLAYFTERFEFLQELTLNTTRTDSLGTARNHASFTYFGTRISDRLVPYAFVDRMLVADNDLHTYPEDERKEAVGLRIEWSPLIHLKLQAERFTRRSAHTHMGGSNREFASTRQLRLQLAYSF